MNMTEFSACCLAKVDRDDGHTRLTVACVRRGNDGKRIVHKREYNLDPLIAQIRMMLAAEHARLHGSESVSGGWDKLILQAEQTARRVGEGRMIRELFGEVSPLLTSGPDEDDPDQRIYQLLTCARTGNERCLATIGAIVNAAYRGNPAALAACQKLRKLHLALEGKEAARIANVSTAGMTTPELVDIGSWWGSFKKIAKKAGKIATAPVWAPAYLATKAVDKIPGVRNLNRINPAAWAIHAVERGSKRPVRPTRSVQAKIAQPRYDSRESAPQEPQYDDAPQEPQYDDAPQEPQYDDAPQDDGPPDEEISGWLYRVGPKESSRRGALKNLYARGV